MHVDPEQPAGSRDLPAVSIVVIGRNEGERLERCLRSIADADYPADRRELIYVDSGSSDGSAAVARNMGAEVIEITSGPYSAARARNLGWRRAKHPLVHFFDGDTEVESQWLRKAVAKLEERGVGCVFGNLQERHPEASVYMRVCALDWHVPSGPWRLCGGVVLVRRQVLEELGGFREDLIAGEEPELSYRLRRRGLTIWRLDEPMALHDLDMKRFGQYWRRIVRSGWAYSVVAVLCRRGKEGFWMRENLANLAETSLWGGLLGWSILARDGRGLVLLTVLVALRCGWIAVRSRGQTENWLSAVLYGLHCQFSRVPFLIGQFRGLWFLITRRPAALIE